MGQPCVINERTGQIVVDCLDEAKGIWQSFKGLMFRPSIPTGYGLRFAPAQGIHTQFMRFPIDVIYLDKQDRVTKIHEAMRPWRLDLTMAAACIEMSAGSARNRDIQPGDTLRVTTHTDTPATGTFEGITALGS